MTPSPDPPPPPPDRRPRLLLDAADFDAYRPERATSNAFTRPRLELKQRLLAWARDVVSRFLELGVAMDVSASDEHPSLRNARRVEFQRVFFWRNAAARGELERLIDQRRTLAATLGDPAPYTKHAFLGLKLDTACVEVSIELHPEAWVDVRNLRARLSDAARALQLTSALEALPEQFALGLAGDGERAQARGAETDAIRALLDRSEADKSPIWLGWSVPRDVAVLHSEILDEQLEDAIVALGPVYKLLAWAPDNDLLVIDREVDAAKAERARHHEEAERAQAEWEARRAEDRKPKKRASISRTAQEGRRRPRVGVGWPDGRDPESARDRAPDAAGDPTPSPPAQAAAHGRRPSLSTPGVKATGPRFSRRAPLVTEVDPSVPIDKGVRVRVLAGPFAGKVGVVQELDGKGSARVMLGLLAMWLEVGQLIASAEGSARPVLASSHRKPHPAR